MGISVVRVTTHDELVGILKIHHENLITNLSEDEKRKEGYVTAEYDMELLQQMHELSPSIVAKDGNDIVGYVLVVTKSFCGKHALLDDLFRCVDAIQYKSQLLSDIDYAMCGQLCVSKSHRGQGIVQMMYEFFREALKCDYKYCVTDVGRANPRSLKAHIKTGFQVIESISYEGVLFDVVLWDWQY